MDTLIKQKAEKWLQSNIDENTKTEIKRMLQEDEKNLIECFYQDLEFGTGGLRGIMGVGSNRVNKYTIGMATQGLCNYLKQHFKDEISIAIAHDCRNQSDYFARITAEICSANGIKAYLFDALRPTPLLSFAVRHLNCQSGVVITASHNPKEYNGYKVYWNDGGQLVSPHDKGVMDEVKKIESINNVRFNPNNALIEIMGEKIDNSFLEYIERNTFRRTPSDLNVVFTALHGTGSPLVPKALRAKGFSNLHLVEEQEVHDGNFPTVFSPNPEESEALSMALKLADKVNADILLGTDPDADRVGVAVRDNSGKMRLLNGNQTGSVLIYYLLEQWKSNGKLKGKEFIAKTIVTSELLKDIAASYQVKSYDVLTGFKFIADLIRKLEGKETFIGGGEESYGYLIGDEVRDKDAVISAVAICEAAAWAKDNGKSFFDLLVDIYLKHGLYKESLLSITKKGKAGLEEIQYMMKNFRQNPPSEVAGEKIAIIKDYLSSLETNSETGKSTPLNFPKSNVLQFISETGSMVTMRPSGTEPKIKFYFGVKAVLASKEQLHQVEVKLDAKINEIKSDLGL